MKTGAMLHPIAVISQKTDLPQDLLRAWERRYQAVVPTRTASGRRMYTDEDLNRLLLLKKALGLGHRIGDVASLELDTLEGLVGAVQPAEVARPSSSPTTLGAQDNTTPLLEQAWRAILNLQGDQLAQTLDQASLELSLRAMLETVVIPLLQRVGDHWHRGELRIAQEHLATAVLRSFLGTQLLRRRLQLDSPVLITATPQGQRHELGAMIAALNAQDCGFDVVHLGADMPAEDIAAVAQLRGACAVALSVMHLADGTQLLNELERLRRLLDSRLPILLGGAQAWTALQLLTSTGRATGFVQLAGLDEFRMLLGELTHRP